MKSGWKKAAVVVLLLMVIMGWFAWTQRHQTFEEVLPMSVETLYKSRKSSDCFYSFDTGNIQLTEEQTDELIRLMNEATYRRNGKANGMSAPGAHICVYLREDSFDFTTIMVNRWYLLVDMKHSGKGAPKYVITSGGEEIGAFIEGLQTEGK